MIYGVFLGLIIKATIRGDFPSIFPLRGWGVNPVESGLAGLGHSILLSAPPKG